MAGRVSGGSVYEYDARESPLHSNGLILGKKVRFGSVDRLAQTIEARSRRVCKRVP